MAENNAMNKQTEDLLIDIAAGDSFINFQIGGTDEFVIGVDDSDADSLKINQGGASPSAGTNVWKMDSLGERSMVLQSSFEVHLTSTVNNVTGDGTLYTILYDNEVFDQNNDFNSTTGVYTCPVTGKCQFEAGANCIGVAVGITDGGLHLITSNYTYIYHLNINTIRTSGYPYDVVAAAEMDAADTAYIDVFVSGIALVIDINANSDLTHFSGTLTC